MYSYCSKIYSFILLNSMPPFSRCIMNKPFTQWGSVISHVSLEWNLFITVSTATATAKQYYLLPEDFIWSHHTLICDLEQQPPSYRSIALYQPLYAVSPHFITPSMGLSSTYTTCIHRSICIQISPKLLLGHGGYFIFLLRTMGYRTRKIIYFNYLRPLWFSI